jgi:hypothetical protein
VQVLAVLNLRSRLAKLIVLGAAMMIALAGLLAFTSEAHAATVLNRFQRSCNFGHCSPFVQTNPPYQPSIGSDCVTNSYTGQSGEYYLPAGHKC